MFRTYEPTRDRLVAVKVFRLDVIPEQAQALADELARAAEAGLFHPSIVEPIAAGIEGTVAYRAEEYVAAESLDVAMRHYAPAAFDKALPFITQLAGAIDFARAAGVGHGALHPRDIFVTPDEARATGFGVVEALERVGLRAPVRRPYSAPERIAGVAWSTPADVFSLAAIAYELLTAKRPSGTGEHIGSLDGAHAGANAARVHAVLARAMEDDPSKRFPTALAFAAALEAAAPLGSFGSAVLGGSVGSVGSALTESEAAQPVRTPEPSEPEDIALERDEDEAHHALLRAEQVDESGPGLFDEEAAADLERPERFADEFAGPQPPGIEPTRGREDSPDRLALDDEIRDAEPTAVEFATAEDPRVFAPVVEAVREPPMFGGSVVEERQRADVLPRAIIFVVGLLIGFLAGHFVAGRDGGVASEPPVATAQPDSSAAPPSQQGKAWSDQPVGQQPAQGSAPRPATPSVTPPATPPAPAEGASPPPAGTKPASKPAAPVATRGTLVVRSTPAGANVTVNGRWRGRTPMTLENLLFGPYTVRVVQTGYVVAREEFTLSAGEPSRTMSVRLRRSTAPPQPEASATRPSAGATVGVGSIYVDSRPRGARVFVDGRAVGVTPLRLADVKAGSHTVRMELADHRTWTATRYVLAGQEVPVTGSLERIR